MGDYFSSIADNIGSANDAMDYNVRNDESIQAIVNYRMAVGDDRSFNFEGYGYLMLLRSLKTSIPRKQQDGTLFHPKLSKWARLSSLHLYVIFITVVSRAAIGQRIGREIKRTTDWTWKIIVQ